LRTASQIHILTGQGAYEAPHASRQLSDLLHQKGIPHFLDLWGHDVAHDWPWWLKMLPSSIDRMGW
jgi:esterase/lipase superfamily enzyme